MLDKRAFTASMMRRQNAHDYDRCTIYGFGARPLFHVIRVTKTKWHVSDNHNGVLVSLKLKRYGASQPMIAISRYVRCPENGLMEESIGVFRKSWRRGYEFILVSELITQGKITTAFVFRNSIIQGDHRYMVGSVTGGCCSQRSGLPITTASILSIPAQGGWQRLHIAEGTDVLLQISIAVSYDLLASARPFYRKDYLY
jgi:hypothetical protein